MPDVKSSAPLERVQEQLDAAHNRLHRQLGEMGETLEVTSHEHDAFPVLRRCFEPAAATYEEIRLLKQQRDYCRGAAGKPEGPYAINGRLMTPSEIRAKAEESARNRGPYSP